MNNSRDFKKEYDAFLAKVPYQTAVVDNIKVRYQYGGKDGTPVILFFNGLEMQAAEILNVPGGHVGFIVQSEYYIDLMEKFLEKNVI